MFKNPFLGVTVCLAVNAWRACMAIADEAHQGLLNMNERMNDSPKTTTEGPVLQPTF